MKARTRNSSSKKTKTRSTRRSTRTARSARKAAPAGTDARTEDGEVIGSGMFSVCILKALLNAAAFSADTALSLRDIKEKIGVDIDVIRFLAKSLAAPGFAGLEVQSVEAYLAGPAPAQRLYIETDAERIQVFADHLAVHARHMRGRANFYVGVADAMSKSVPAWNSTMEG